MREITSLPTRPRTHGHKTTCGIVASQVNPDHVQALVNAATMELRNLAPNVVLTLVPVPGAFEIPYGIRILLSEKKVDVIIALGVIIEGETDHARLIGDSVTYAIHRLALDSGVPIIHGIVSAKSVEQADARCMDPDNNRGIEAARAAIEMARLLDEHRKE
ncbi:MAG: 6,7-dimethyl-8-ribityllumazine synthase [Verrucomicrobiia bacterium]